MSEQPKMGLLDLVPAGPVRSDVFDFKGQRARWRLLDSLEVMGCRHAAERRVMRVLVDDMGLDPKDAYQLAQAGGDSQREWFEYYVISAAMIDRDGDPLSLDSPDDVAQVLADKTTPIERAKLIDEYLQFADEHDPSNLSDEETEEIIAALGKGDASTSLRLGSNSLRSLVNTMAPRLVMAEAKLAEMEDQEDLEARVSALETSLMHRSPDGSDLPSV